MVASVLVNINLGLEIVSDVQLSVFSLLIYKVLSLSSGVFLSWLGYKLFQNGVWGNAGELSGKYKDNELLLKSAAPGTFFVVLGSLIILVSVFSGFNTMMQVPTSAPTLP